MNSQWQQASGLYLSGRWIKTNSWIEVTDPATELQIARVNVLTGNHLKRGLDVASQAYPGWSKLPASERKAWLERLAQELHRRAEEAAELITLENGKPIAQSRGEVAMAEDHLRWFAEEACRAYGRIIPHSVAGKRNFVIKTPVGVVGAIAPWNFPLVLAVRKIAPALAAGCTVILKPARQTPLSSILLAQCVEAVGLPVGVFQLVLGDAQKIAAEFLSNPICRKISFTGSTKVGQELIRAAAATVKPLSLELGGLAPLIVFEDCNLERAVQQTLVAKFRNTGQSCIAANRIYLQRVIAKKFLEQFVAGVKALRVGNGLQEHNEVGPMISQSALNGALLQIDDAIQKGAKVLCGGGRLNGHPGYFLEPTVLIDANSTMLCMQEESFAPIAPIQVFDTEEEVLELANNTIYGLSAYAMTRDLGRILRLTEQIEAGTIGVNDGAPTVSQCPFGGVKQSGWGRELGQEGLDAFLVTKHISIGGIDGV